MIRHCVCEKPAQKIWNSELFLSKGMSRAREQPPLGLNIQASEKGSLGESGLKLWAMCLNI